MCWKVELVLIDGCKKEMHLSADPELGKRRLREILEETCPEIQKVEKITKSAESFDKFAGVA